MTFGCFVWNLVIHVSPSCSDTDLEASWSHSSAWRSLRWWLPPTWCILQGLEVVWCLPFSFQTTVCLPSTKQTRETELRSLQGCTCHTFSDYPKGYLSLLTSSIILLGRVQCPRLPPTPRPQPLPPHHQHTLIIPGDFHIQVKGHRTHCPLIPSPLRESFLLPLCHPFLWPFLVLIITSSHTPCKIFHLSVSDPSSYLSGSLTLVLLHQNDFT